jgi:hypothetical protein
MITLSIFWEKIDRSALQDSAVPNIQGDTMNIDRLVFAVAGSFILLSVILSQIHSPYWLYFTAFVGANLLQSSFTGFCPMAMILKKFGLQSGHAFS